MPPTARQYTKAGLPWFDYYGGDIAVVNGIEYLVTWNYRHIANATIRSQIETVCRNAGFEPAIICTPDELMERDHDDE